MKRLVDLVVLDRMDSLIRRQATGTPNDFAKRLGISLRRLYELIAFLRDEMQAPIKYSAYLISYIYDYPPKFYLGFERDRTPPVQPDKLFGGAVYNYQYTYSGKEKTEDVALIDIYGGRNNEARKAFLKDIDPDDYILDDDVNFNDLFIN